MASNHPSQHRLRLVAILLLGVGLMVSMLQVPSEAVVATSITSSGLGTVVSPISSGVVTITGGTRPGNGPNLFHSFGEFSIAASNTANFFNDSGLTTNNILARVTGGLRSDIYGTIQTTGFGNANLFLMNPAGIMFGPNASLNVGGSVHFTTADYLRLADNVSFNAVPNAAQDALLSTAPVAAFGFLNPNPAPITVQGSTLSVSLGQTLSLVGGDITITADPATGTPSALLAPSGQINLASVASPGEILLPTLETAPNIMGQSFTALGTINISQGATVDVSDNFFAGDGHGGSVVIRGGRLMMDQSSIFSNTFGDVDGANPGIDVNTANDITLTNGALISVSTSGLGRTGDIKVTSGTIDMSGFGSGLISDTTGNGLGANLSLTAQKITLEDGASLQARTFFTGQGGDIIINAGTLNLLSGAQIVSHTEFFDPTAGPSGKVNVQGLGGEGTVADAVTISGLGSGIFSNSFGLARPGDIVVNTNTFSLADGGVIDSGSMFQHQGGNVTVTATGSITMSSGSSISSAAFDTDAGQLHLSAPTINIDGSSITASSLNTGRGGDIILEGTNVNLTNGARLDSSAAASGNAGDIHITAADQLMMQNSAITTQALFSDGGNIDIHVGNVIRLINSSITTSVGTGTGNGGNITIDPQFFVMTNSQILAQAFGGDGGNINITADIFLIDPLSVIDASSRLGVSGAINIDAPITNLSGTLTPLSPEFLHANVLLRSRCAARAGSSMSSFVVAGRDGIPVEPGGLLPSPLAEAGTIGAAESSPGQGTMVALNLAAETLDGACAQ